MMVFAGFCQLAVFEEGEGKSHDSWIAGNDSKNWRGTGFEPRPEPVPSEETTCPSVPATTPGKIARHADTAKDGDNVLHMVWQMPIDGNYEICYSNNRGDGREGNMGIGNGWNTALRLSHTPTHSILPDIEIDKENGIIFVTWTELLVPESEVYTMSFDGGLTWLKVQPNPGVLLLKTEEFDPLVGMPEIPDELGTVKHTGYYLLQFRIPPMVEWIQKMRTMGVDFLGYVPYNGYIAAMDKNVRPQVENLVYVRWTGIFQPAFKVSPDLASAAGMVNIAVQMLADNWPDVVEDIESMGGILSFMSLSGWLASVVLSVNASHITDIARINDVFWLEHYAAPSPSTEVIDQIMAGNYNLVAGANVPTGPGYNAWLNNRRLNGAGVTVSVVDSGIDTGVLTTMHRDIRGRVQGLVDYTETDNSDGVCEDEWWHGTHLAGIVAGDATIGTTDNRGYLYGLGGAPAADLLCQRIFDSTAVYSNTADNVLTAWAVSNGADISSNSWGTSGAANLWGNYLAASRDYDMLVRDADPWTGGNQSLIIVFSAGNDGFDAANNAVRPNSIHAQGSAKNVITIGASESYRTAWTESDNMDDVAFFSSRGPTDDNRLKPDVVTPGTRIGSLNSTVGWSTGWGPIGGTNDYIWGGGTSMATPLASSAAALFVQYYDDITGNRPSPALTKAALINGAVDMMGGVNGAGGAIPNNDEGWGRVHLGNMFDRGPRFTRYVDETVSLRTNQNVIFRYYVNDTNVPLRVSLVWTDEEGTINAIPALVNDLNLNVTAPDGTTYNGNAFWTGGNSAGWAQPNPGQNNANPQWDGNWNAALRDGYDEVNNVENVYVMNPIRGNYTIRIDARFVDAARPAQDFALVVSGGLANPFNYTISANVAGQPPVVQTGNAFVDDVNDDKFILNAGSVAGASYNVSINVTEWTRNGYVTNTYYADQSSDIGIVRSGEVRAWMVGRDLHAASRIAEFEPHPFSYRIEAEGTKSPEFDYVVTASQTETYWAYNTVFTHIDDKSDLSSASGSGDLYLPSGYTMHTWWMSPSDGKCKKGIWGTVGTLTVTQYSDHLHYHYHISAGYFACHWGLWATGKKVDTKLWFRSSSRFNDHVNVRDGTRFLQNYPGGTGFTPTPDTISVTPVAYGVTDYIPGTILNHPDVNTFMVGSNVYANTSLDEPLTTRVPDWSRTTNGNSVVNHWDGILTVTTYNPNFLWGNNDLTYRLTITVAHNAGQTTYTDINGDGTVECGLFNVWMGGASGNQFNASVGTRPPAATIVSINPGNPNVGQTVSFTGTGNDYMGNSIVAYEWMSGSFNYSFSPLSSSANFQMTATTSSGGLTKGHQRVYFRVRNSAGIWSPMASQVVSVT